MTPPSHHSNLSPPLSQYDVHNLKYTIGLSLLLSLFQCVRTFCLDLTDFDLKMGRQRLVLGLELDNRLELLASAVLIKGSVSDVATLEE